MKRFFGGVVAVSIMAVCGLVSAQNIEQTRGADQRVNYPDLARIGPWDDRNYDLTAEDLEWLGDDEETSPSGIPAFFKVELRKEFPNLRRRGEAQYPRAALQIFKIRYGGLMQNGVLQGQPRAALDRTAVSTDSEVQLSDVISADESTVEINPVFPDVIIAGSNASGGQKMYYSADGGATWGIGEQGSANGVLDSTCCDPTVGWSSDGTIGYAATLSSSIGVSFYTSTDFGVTWSSPKILTVSGSDKEFLHVDISSTSPYKDNVYLTYHNNNTMQFARSTDFGQNFTITAFPGEPAGIGSDITTDSAGNIYYLYASFDSGTIELLKSTNGGNSFASSLAIDSTNGIFDFPIPSMETRRAWIYAAADSDRSGGPFDGNVYCAWTDTTGPESGIASNNHTQIIVARSSDSGATWQTSIPHNAADSNTVDRFNQWLVVDEFGIVHVVFYDTQNSVNRTGVDLYYTNSDDGGVTWDTPTRVSTVTSDNMTDGQEWGDYNGVSVVNGQIVATWTDNRPPGSNSTGDVIAGLLTLELADTAEIWVDFGHTGSEIGSQSSPFNTLIEGLIAVDAGGVIKIKGDTGTPSTSTVGMITKALRMEAVSGAIQIGLMARLEAAGSSQLSVQLEVLRDAFGLEAYTGEVAADTAAIQPFEEPILPFTSAADVGEEAKTLAIQLIGTKSADASSPWSRAVLRPTVVSASEALGLSEPTQDIWVMFQPDEHAFLDEVIAVTGALDDADALIDGVGSSLSTGSTREYSPAVRIWLPLPKDQPSNVVGLYYYETKETESRWIPAEEVPGWLVPDSEVRITVDGTTYLGYLIRHAAVVQLAIRD